MFPTSNVRMLVLVPLLIWGKIHAPSYSVGELRGYPVVQTSFEVANGWSSAYGRIGFDPYIYIYIHIHIKNKYKYI
jgi:hypothetical protein